MKNKKGFTLVELLVVIAIIGLLATIAFISLNSARGKARDAKRISDVRTIQSTLELYYNDITPVPGYPPVAAITTIPSIWSAIVPSYMAQVPTAPTPADSTDCNVPTTDNSYNYRSYGVDGVTICDAAPCASYKISFCLGSASGGLAAGCVNVSPTGLSNAACLVP